MKTWFYQHRCNINKDTLKTSFYQHGSIINKDAVKTRFYKHRCNIKRMNKEQVLSAQV